MPDSNTILELVGMGIPPYSARGLSQSYTPIAAAVSLRRTINGDLRDLAAPQFQKYNTSISGSDQEPPAVDGLWPGHTITVHCITELAVLDPYTESTEPPSESETEPVLGRPHVPGSVRRANGFIFYRPIMECKVTGFNVDGDEWEAGVDWTLDLEEV